MAAESTGAQLVDKKGGSYSAIAPKLEPGKFKNGKKLELLLIYFVWNNPITLNVFEEAKATRTDLVHSFEGSSGYQGKLDIGLYNLEYYTFRAKTMRALTQPTPLQETCSMRFPRWW
ncbi:hypothetical protein Tco_1162236 [Tanacetum coccineum]